VLYNVSPSDAVSTAAAAGLLVLASIAACLPPALRAMRVDLVAGLRAE
jgi:ABC-type lipoprotein release transport system permease subunit